MRGKTDANDMGGLVENKGKVMFPVSKLPTKLQTPAMRKPAPARAMISVLAVSLLVSGCASLNKAIGAGKNSPDEFAVVTKAPLVIPPDFSLRPPKPGAKRPQEADVAVAAANAVFSGKAPQGAASQSNGELMLLTVAGADDADDSIRDVVNSEYYNTHRPGDGFANKILFWKGDTVDPASLVDTAAEEERVRTEEALGQPATE